MTKPKVAVDIWSDVMCPWCAVGYTSFARAVEGLRDEIEVEVRWMPFELNPDGSLRVTGCVLVVCRSKRWTRSR